MIHRAGLSAQAVKCCWRREGGEWGAEECGRDQRSEQLLTTKSLRVENGRCPQGGSEDTSPDLRAACGPPEVVNVGSCRHQVPGKTAAARTHVPM